MPHGVGGTVGVPTSCVGTTDAGGSGALRLTSATNERAGYLLYDRALPTRGGLDISFTQYQWGGSGADGISFFLTDGEYDLNQAGPSGGSLGYNARDLQANGSAADQPGLAHALLGIGLDAFGNVPYETHDPNCSVSRAAALVKDVIAIRGPAGGSPTESTILASVAGEVPSEASTTVEPRGSGPFSFSIATPPSADQGTATIDPTTGEIIFTAAPGYSGIVDIDYRITKASGLSADGSYRVIVEPRAAAKVAITQSGIAGTTQVYTPPTHVGDGPFTFLLRALPSEGEGAVSIDAKTGVITFTPADGFSGTARVSYLVIDANGLQSSPVTVTFEVVVATTPAGLASTGAEAAPILWGALLAGLVGIGLILVVRARRVPRHRA